MLTANGSGTDVSLRSDANATLAALGHDSMNFVGDTDRALSGNGFMLGSHGFGSGSVLHTDAALLGFGGHGSSANALIDHGIAHASVMLR